MYSASAACSESQVCSIACQSFCSSSVAARRGRNRSGELSGETALRLTRLFFFAGLGGVPGGVRAGRDWPELPSGLRDDDDPAADVRDDPGVEPAGADAVDIGAGGAGRGQTKAGGGSSQLDVPFILDGVWVAC